jgi:hypothetical protein
MKIMFTFCNKYLLICMLAFAPVLAASSQQTAHKPPILTTTAIIDGLDYKSGKESVNMLKPK